VKFADVVVCTVHAAVQSCIHDVCFSVLCDTRHYWRSLAKHSALLYVDGIKNIIYL